MSKAELLELRAITSKELGEAAELAEEYVGTSTDQLRDWWRAEPEWIRGAFLDSKLLGVCYGCRGRGDTAVLQGIGVRAEHWRQGLGTALIQDFEARIAVDGVSTVSLGSASDIPTERFYVRNCYEGTELVLEVSNTKCLAAGENVELQPREVTMKEGRIELRFAVSKYSTQQRAQLVKAWGASDAMFVFEKRLGRRQHPT